MSTFVESREPSVAKVATGMPAEAVAPPSSSEPNVIRAVIDQLSRIQPGRLLDAPAGFGAVSFEAQRRGFDVTACDIETEKFMVPGITCEQVDLQAHLPYDDATFDVIVCAEGIEHLENPYHLLRQFRRVLRPGGRLIVTTPNVVSLPSRIRYLTTGLQSWFDFDWNLDGNGHITPIGIPQLHTAMDRAGFTIRDIAGNRVTRTGKLLAPLTPIIRFATRRRVVKPALRELLTSTPVLLCEILVVVAE